MNFRQKTLNRLTSEKGVSLLEIFIAISIFSVGVLAVAQMQIMAIRTNRSNAMHVGALNVAQDQMELIVGARYLTLDSLAGESTEQCNGVTYTVTVTPGSETGSVDNRVRPVLVQVSYEYGDKARSFSLTTYKAEAEG